MCVACVCRKSWEGGTAGAVDQRVGGKEQEFGMLWQAAPNVRVLHVLRKALGQFACAPAPMSCG